MTNTTYTIAFLGLILLGTVAFSTSAVAQNVPLVSVMGDFDGDGDTDRALRAVGSDAWFVSLGSRVDDDGIVRMDIQAFNDGRTDFRPGKGQFETFVGGYVVWGHATWNFVYASGLNGTFAVYEDGRVRQKTSKGRVDIVLDQRDALVQALGLEDALSPFATSDVSRGRLFRHFKRARLQASR